MGGAMHLWIALKYINIYLNIILNYLKKEDIYQTSIS